MRWISRGYHLTKAFLKSLKGLSAFGERLSAGYHNGNLRNDPWRRRWYEEINKLDYHCNNELQMIRLLNAIRRVNCQYASMYPFEKTKGDTEHIRELSLNIHPGSMLGVDISSRILNHGTFLLMGISGKDIKERVSVSERRWKKYMAGWPTFLSVSGWINRDKLRLPAGYKLVTFARVVFL